MQDPAVSPIYLALPQYQVPILQDMPWMNDTFVWLIKSSKMAHLLFEVWQSRLSLYSLSYALAPQDMIIYFDTCCIKAQYYTDYIQEHQVHAVQT
jgi:hypothetical protein